MYFVEDKKVTILFLEGRQSGLASDGKTFLESHLPVVEIRKDRVTTTAGATGIVEIPREVQDKTENHYLWFLDRDQVIFTPLSGSSKKPLAVPDNTKHPYPPNDSNKNHFGWVVAMTDIEPGILLRREVLDPKAPVEVSARLELTFGSFTTFDCCLDSAGDFQNFDFDILGGSGGKNIGGLGNGVIIDLGQLADLEIHRHDFADTVRRETVTLKAGAEAEVITLWNSPITHILTPGMPSDQGTFVPHFELLYKAVTGNSKKFVPHGKAPPPDNANLSCPPAQISR
jgi:hypothetical protein